jgi:hypothetical protein
LTVLSADDCGAVLRTNVAFPNGRPDRRFGAGSTDRAIDTRTAVGGRPVSRSSGPFVASGEHVLGVSSLPEGRCEYSYRFVSDAMARRYGRRSLELASGTWASRVLGGRDGDDGGGGIERRRRGAVVVGTAAEHRTFERRLKAATPGMDTDPESRRYSGPLYVYRGGGPLSRSEPDELRVRDRTGPINVVWRAGTSTSDAACSPDEVSAARVKETMEGPGGWRSPVPTWWARARYVPVQAGEEARESRPAAAEVQRRIGRFDPFEQYHVRLYDVSDADRTHPVVGQAHWDPSTHDWPVPFTPSPGRFTESRRAVLSTWRELGVETSVSGPDALDHPHGSDGRFDSFDGRIGVVSVGQ